MTKPQKYSDDDVLAQQLQHEIIELEQKKTQIEEQINQFQIRIRSAMFDEMEEVSVLTELYKQHKKAKREKRLEQKRRGKNYKATTSDVVKHKNTTLTTEKADNVQSLKKIYKEAVVLIHPDKVEDQNEVEKIKQAADLTAQLNNIYKNGDLEELTYFYHHIILSQISEKAVPKNDYKTKREVLSQKKKRLEEAIAELQNSYLYHVLNHYDNPNDFLIELKNHFQDKIKKLKKRTRKIR
ncbi:hypothetical protein GCM10011506_19510 [Marivirga lumbricoides]|uniref:J domain-containing protein n=1 Tax=Marivirga lumbricoides TaxID=1046115 RepID=A0ABQ1M4D0_9BACT|nr:hypothetical protein GCM10011506_19510 [Marivirga lumbricoides]